MCKARQFLMLWVVGSEPAVLGRVAIWDQQVAPYGGERDGTDVPGFHPGEEYFGGSNFLECDLVRNEGSRDRLSGDLHRNAHRREVVPKGCPPAAEVDELFKRRCR